MLTGRVTRTAPSVRRQSGLVKTSSVGRFGTNSRPSGVDSPAPIQLAPGMRPTVRSVPSPRKRMESNARAFIACSRPRRRSMCSRQAATGSASSRRMAVATASHRRSTSASPKTRCPAGGRDDGGGPRELSARDCLHPGAVQLDPRAATSSGSRPSNSPGSGTPARTMLAAPSSRSSATCSSSQR